MGSARQTIRVKGKIATKPAGNSTLAVAQRTFPKLWVDQHASLLWADRFDSDLASLSQTQSEITGRLARTINFKIADGGAQDTDRDHSS
jgi:TolB-like protein